MEEIKINGKKLNPQQVRNLKKSMNFAKNYGQENVPLKVDSNMETIKPKYSELNCLRHTWDDDPKNSLNLLRSMVIK